MKKKARYMILTISLICILSGVILLFMPLFGDRRPTYVFQNQFWELRVSSFLESVRINKQEYAGYWRVFHYEEQTKLTFRTEGNIKFYTIACENYVQLIAYSELANSEMHKVFTFYKLEPKFTVWIQKGYTKSGFLTNNQLMIDLKCKYLETNLKGSYGESIYRNNTVDGSLAWIKFYGLNNFTLTLLDSTPQNSYLQLPTFESIVSRGSAEVQLNYYGLRDESLFWYSQGTVESSLFQFELELSA